MLKLINSDVRMRHCKLKDEVLAGLSRVSNKTKSQKKSSLLEGWKQYERVHEEDKAFRVLFVIGLFGILLWSTYGHAIAYCEDTLRETYGEEAWQEGFRMDHLHSLADSLAALQEA